MSVSVGGAQIGSIYKNTTECGQYSFVFTATAATQELRVAINNDFLGAVEDRNLMVDEVAVGCPASGCVGSTASVPLSTITLTAWARLGRSACARLRATPRGMAGACFEVTGPNPPSREAWKANETAFVMCGRGINRRRDLNIHSGRMHE
jgi:hypothetical protein